VRVIRLDGIDTEILKILRQEARTTNSDIAITVGLTEGAVRNRIRRLVRSGVIKRFTIETDPDQVEAIVLVRTQTRASRDILKKIRKFTDRLFETSGEYDVAAYLSAQSVDEINTTIDRVRSVSGVISTLTLLKMAEDQTEI
jgi:DNA-binding Lrp family transcriptional regulator